MLGIVVVLAPCAHAITIDRFTNNFPANPGLPASGAELLFVGSMCDGSACPPGTVVSHLVNDAAYQTGLSGVLGGERYAVITRYLGTSSTDVYSPANLFEISQGPGATSIVTLTYGLNINLNSNFTVMGATQLQVDVIEGEMSATRPVPFTITVTSGRGTANEHTASVTKTITISAGIVAFPFSEFALVDFTDVDGITYKFDASAYAARAIDCAFGPLVTDEHEVGVEPTTWGAVKSLFE